MFKDEFSLAFYYLCLIISISIVLQAKRTIRTFFIGILNYSQQL